MQGFVEFLVEVGKLKKMGRTGWILRDIKNPETIAEHTFRMAIMAWILGKRESFNLTRVLKIALIHDLCEIYAGDITPYNGLLPDNKKLQKIILSKFPRLPRVLKEEKLKEKHEKEKASLEKVISGLPYDSQKEIMSLWLDYENGITKEGRFVKQVDRVENLLQALEYWERNRKFPIEPWWIQLKELVDDPNLLKFMEALDQRFQKKYNTALHYEHSRSRKKGG